MAANNPDTERTEEGDWRCKKCGGVGWCSCEDDEALDPICDCGWLGWMCHCEEVPDGK